MKVLDDQKRGNPLLSEPISSFSCSLDQD